ncbi:hypothetical protein FEM48_Zijuj09G0039700 [Ziziphus jujuba var. spinosa]|uniref:Protein TIME FOR COFFEE n=1 Tax=Ziziphus jujuba var. spinosa TaxID=714518 RepID=A0A978UQS1_ZIZJJ|nr:hypothetical protein FEM48_Zijuj09G0039700 [Ziziphus jujuba var. spinosa]
MERSREARRPSMTAVTTGLLRRRNRTAAFRDSPEDEQVDLEPGKKNRSRGDMLNRNKRRRGGSNREEGEEASSEVESVDNDEEEDCEVDDDAGLANRKLSPTTATSSSSPSNLSHRRNSLPARLSKQSPTSLKVSDEMIGVPVPRKARSASAKRSVHDYGSSGSGRVGDEQSYRQRSNSPARLSVEVASPSSSKFSVRKKMKSSGPKTRPPKASKTSGLSQDDIEFEIAEVLFGLMKQSQSSKHQDSNKKPSSKLETKDSKNNNHGLDLMPVAFTVVKEKKSLTGFPVAKEKEMKAVDSSTTFENSSSVEPVTTESGQPEKMDVSSPKLENESKSNADLCEHSRAVGVDSKVAVSGSMEMQDDPKPSNGLDDGVVKPVSSDDQSSVPRLDFDIQDLTATKETSTVAAEVERQREEEFKIDLMAPPPVASSPERDGVAPPVSKPESLIKDVEMKLDNTMMKDKEKVERPVKKESAFYEEKKTETSVEKREVLKLDLEKPCHDMGCNQQAKATISKLEKAEKTRKNWYMPPFQTVVSTGSSTSLQPSKPPLLSQPQPKRCATHHYIAHNIYLHQQLTKINNIWPAAAGSAPQCGTKPNNLSVMPPAEKMTMGTLLLGNVPGVNLSHSKEKGKDAGDCPGHNGKDKISGAANKETSQIKQIVLPQAPQPAFAGNLVHGPAFVFPPSRQQAAITATSNQPGSSKSVTSTNNAALSSNSAIGPLGSSSALPSVATTMSFNYQNLAAKEVPYMAIMQNNGYPFPISTPFGTAPAHAQAMPFFNGSFYPSQMLHPSQLQQQQPHSHLPVHPTHQNATTSSGSSPSHRQPESQKLRGTQNSGNNVLNSSNMQLKQSQKHYMPASHQSLKLEAGISAEISPSTADTRASQAPKGVSCQNYAVQFQPLNYTLMPTATLVGQGGGSRGEQSQQHSFNGGVELIPSQAFAMSLPPFAGNGTASSLSFSSMPQNPAMFQSLPHTVRKEYQMPAPQAMQHKNHRVPERKTGSAPSNPDDGTKAVSRKYHSTVGQTLLAFDNSPRTLNFMSPPVAGNWPSRPISSTSITTNASVAENIPSNCQQQHLFQFQLQNQQMLQHQQHVVSARSKAPTTNSLPPSSVAANFANNGPVFSQALVHCNASVQSPQSKTSGRTVVSQAPNMSLTSSSASTFKNFSQQGRASPGHSQISFGGNSDPVPA